MNLIEKKLETSCINFIGAYFLENTQVCDSLINYFKNNPKKQQHGASRKKLSSGKSELGIYKEIKDSMDIYIHPDDRGSEWQLYRYELEKVIKAYTEKFPKSTHTAPWGLKEFTNLQYYKPGGGYFDWHSERLSASGHISARNLVFMTYLNDVIDQGETEFYHQKIRVVPEKGLTLIWPSDWTHYHRGIPSPTQEKYIITGWLSFFQ